jgi:hypothetical protein
MKDMLTAFSIACAFTVTLILILNWLAQPQPRIAVPAVIPEPEPIVIPEASFTYLMDSQGGAAFVCDSLGRPEPVERAMVIITCLDGSEVVMALSVPFYVTDTPIAGTTIQ